MHILGIDIGGTGIKAAPVDTATGQLLAERVRLATPRPSTPDAVAGVVAEVLSSFPDLDGPLGCTFPAVVKRGVTLTAANVDATWIGLDADVFLTDRLQREVHLLNDADAAGIAEMQFGVGRGRDGVVVLVTIGTGLGTAVFVDRTLVPNTELGHIEIRGVDAEGLASERIRVNEGLSWKRYARRLDEYLGALERYLHPDLLILGGGGSKKAQKFLGLLQRSCEVLPAEHGNTAGIIGAAFHANRAAAKDAPTLAPRVD